MITASFATYSKLDFNSSEILQRFEKYLWNISERIIDFSSALLFSSGLSLLTLLQKLDPPAEQKTKTDLATGKTVVEEKHEEKGLGDSISNELENEDHEEVKHRKNTGKEKSPAIHRNRKDPAISRYFKWRMCYFSLWINC